LICDCRGAIAEVRLPIADLRFLIFDFPLEKSGKKDTILLNWPSGCEWTKKN